MSFDSYDEMIDRLGSAMMGVTNDRFERDTRAYTKTIKSGPNRKKREGMRQDFLAQMDDLQEEIHDCNKRILYLLEGDDWSKVSVLEILEDISYEAREFVGRTILSKLTRAMLRRAVEERILEKNYLRVVEDTVRDLMGRACPLRYNLIARNVDSATLCPAEDFQTQRVVANVRRSAPPRSRSPSPTRSRAPSRVPRRAPPRPPSPTTIDRDHRRTPSPISDSSPSTASMDFEDLIGRSVYMNYPRHGWYWGTVVGPDPVKESNVIIFHEEDNEYVSRKAVDVRRRLKERS